MIRLKLSVSILLVALGCGGNSKGGLSSAPDGGVVPGDDAEPGSRANVEASAVGLDDDAGAQGGAGTGGGGAGGTGSAGQGLVIAPASYSFGTVVPGQRSDIVTFTIANLATVPSGVPSISITEDSAKVFTLLDNGCITPLPGNATCQATVFFRPTSDGAETASLAVTASPGGSVSSRLSGIGGHPPPPPDSGTPIQPDATPPVPIAAFSPVEVTIPNSGPVGSSFIRFRLVNAGSVRFLARPALSQDPFPAGSGAAGMKIMFMSSDPEQCRDGEKTLLPGDGCNVDVYYTGEGGRAARTVRVWAMGDAGPIATAAIKVSAGPP